MSAVRYCDHGGCIRPSTWLATYTKLNGERCTSASCARCLPQMMNLKHMGIQEKQPLSWVEFKKED